MDLWNLIDWQKNIQYWWSIEWQPESEWRERSNLVWLISKPKRLKIVFNQTQTKSISSTKNQCETSFNDFSVISFSLIIRRMAVAIQDRRSPSHAMRVWCLFPFFDCDHHQSGCFSECDFLRLKVVCRNLIATFEPTTDRRLSAGWSISRKLSLVQCPFCLRESCLFFFSIQNFEPTEKGNVIATGLWIRFSLRVGRKSTNPTDQTTQ